MKYIYLIAAFNAFFFVILLLQKKNRALHDNILIFWLIYLGLYTGVYAFYSHNLFEHFPLLSSSFISLFMLHGPLLYLYTSSLALKKNALATRDFIHFVPFLLFNFYLFPAIFSSAISQGISLDHSPKNIEPPLLFLAFLLLTVLSGPVYFLLSIKLFRKLDVSISNNFSYSEDIDLDWLRKLVFIFGVIWSALMIIASIYHVLHLFSMTFCTDGLFLSLSVFIILVGYFGLKQKEIFIHYSMENQDYITDTPKKYAGSDLKEADAKEYAEKLKRYMETDKPYLNPSITLPQLANNVKIPSYHLSQVINEIFEQNFFDFINQYRVDEVKIKILDKKYSNYSLLGVAYECGFNSKSAFNRIFKKVTGQTPTQYKESNSN